MHPSHDCHRPEKNSAEQLRPQWQCSAVVAVAARLPAAPISSKHNTQVRFPPPPPFTSVSSSIICNFFQAFFVCLFVRRPPPDTRALTQSSCAETKRSRRHFPIDNDHDKGSVLPTFLLLEHGMIRLSLGSRKIWEKSGFCTVLLPRPFRDRWNEQSSHLSSRYVRVFELCEPT